VATFRCGSTTDGSSSIALFSTHAAKELARRFGRDPSSADWRHFGRLAGFTNQKPKRRLPSGFPTFVRLRQCEGARTQQRPKFLEEVKYGRGEGKRLARGVDYITFDFHRRFSTIPQ
jgi:DNA primase RepB-like protein